MQHSKRVVRSLEETICDFFSSFKLNNLMNKYKDQIDPEKINSLKNNILKYLTTPYEEEQDLALTEITNAIKTNPKLEIIISPAGIAEIYLHIDGANYLTYVADINGQYLNHAGIYYVSNIPKKLQ